MAQYVVYLNTAGEAFMEARRKPGDSIAKTISHFIKESVEAESVETKFDLRGGK